MNKLLKFKKWIKLDEAANYLSIVLDEKVEVSDILRLALDGHIKLSVNFVNHAKARKGKRLPYKDAEVVSMPSLIEGRPEMLIVCGLKIFNQTRDIIEEVIQFDKDVVTIYGVWDLTMMGGESLDVEHEYQMLTDGPRVELINIDGCYIEDYVTGTIYALQASFDDYEFTSGSRAELEKIRNHIAFKELSDGEADLLLNKHKEDRKLYLQKLKDKGDSSNYYPAGGLPQNADFVVRTQEILAFIDIASGNHVSSKMPSDKEFESMLKIIHALAKNGYRYPSHGSIKDMLKDFELNINGVSEKTLKKYLDEFDKL